MKRIKIFLASSAELEPDRREFEILIARKCADWAEQDVFLQVVLWEDFLDALSATRLQDEYNKRIRECDLFVLLFWSKVGMYTEEEFGVAVGQFQATRKPFIFTYFKDEAGGTPDPDGSGRASVDKFKQRLGDLGHFFTVYRNVDALKLHFTQQLDKLAKSGFIQLKPADVAQPVPDVHTQLSHLTIAAAAQGEGAVAVGVNSGTVVAGDLTINYGIQSLPANFKSRIKRFLQSYLGSAERPVPFGGRSAELALLGRWLTDGKSPRNLLLTGPAASGKSALLIRWLHSVPEGQWKKVFVPISVRYETNRPDVFFGACACAVADALGQRLQAPAGDPAQFYRDKLTELLDAWDDDSPQCLLAIDGLDEAMAWQLDTSVLPPEPHPRLRIVLSAREMAHCDADEWERRVGWKVDRAPVYRLSIAGLEPQAVLHLVQAVGLGEPKPMARAISDELVRLTDGDPLLLQLYLQEMLEHTARGRPAGVDALKAAKPGFSAYFAAWMDQQRKLVDPGNRTQTEDEIKACLALLACAAGPLRHDDLEELVPRVLGKDCVVDRDTLQPIERFIVGDGDRHGYTYAHPKFGIFVREEYLLHGPWIERAEAAYVQWGEGVAQDLDTGSLAPADVPPYVLQYLFLHLRAAKASLAQWRRLTSNGWRQAWLQAEGGTNGFARDVLEVMRQASQVAFDDGEPVSEAFALLVRAALIHSSIRSRGSRIPGSLIAAGVRHGSLAMRSAKSIAAARGEPGERLDMLLRLAEVGTADDWEELAQELLAQQDFADAADAIRVCLARGRLLVTLGAAETDPQVCSQWDQAMVAMRGLHLYEFQALILEVGSRLSPGQAEQVWDLFRQLEGNQTYAGRLWPLVSSLPEQRLPELLKPAFRYASNGPDLDYAHSFAQALPRLSSQARVQLLHQVWRSTDWRSSELPDEPAAEDTEAALLERLLNGPPSPASTKAQVMALPLMSPSQARQVLDRVLAARPGQAAHLDLESDQAALGIALALMLPHAWLGDLLKHLLTMDQSGAVLALLPRLAPEQQAIAMADANFLSSLASGSRVQLKSADEHQALSKETVRLLLTELMNVHDEVELSAFEADAIRAHPACRAAHYERALAHAVTAMKRNTPAESALRSLAPLLTLDDLRLTRQAASGEHEWAAALVNEVMDAGLPELAAACGVAGESAVTADKLHYMPSKLAECILALAARGFRSPELVACLRSAFAANLHGEKPGLKERAYRNLSAQERAVVRPSDPREDASGLDAEIAVLALGAAFEPDDALALQDLSTLIDRMHEWAGQRSQPVHSYEAVGLMEAFKVAAEQLRRLDESGVAWAAQRMFDTALAIPFRSASDRAGLLWSLGGSHGPAAEAVRAAAVAAAMPVFAEQELSDRIRLLKTVKAALPAHEFRSLCKAQADELAQLPPGDARLARSLDLLLIAPKELALPDWQSDMVSVLGHFVPELAREFEPELRSVIRALAPLVIDEGPDFLSGQSTHMGQRLLDRLGPDACWACLPPTLLVSSFAVRAAVLAVLTMAAPLMARVDGGRLLEELLDSEREVVSWYP